MATNNITTLCVMCNKQKESTDHLFIHGKLASRIWHHNINDCRLVWCFPGTILEVLVQAFPLRDYSVYYFLFNVEGKKKENF